MSEVLLRKGRSLVRHGSIRLEQEQNNEWSVVKER